MCGIAGMDVREPSQQTEQTFSVGFAEEVYNERPYARQVAQRFATDHHEMLVTPDVAGLLPRLVWQYDEPFADKSAVPTPCMWLAWPGAM
jgi:asparagine synthase (glutamine-hydrolysing)